MLHENTTKLTVVSAIGMCGGCTITFSEVSYDTYIDEEDGETYVSFDVEKPTKWVWCLTLNGSGATAYIEKTPHEKCPKHFLDLVKECAMLCLVGDSSAIVKLIIKYNEKNKFVFY